MTFNLELLQAAAAGALVLALAIVLYQLLRGDPTDDNTNVTGGRWK